MHHPGDRQIEQWQDHRDCPPPSAHAVRLCKRRYFQLVLPAGRRSHRQVQGQGRWSNRPFSGSLPPEHPVHIRLLLLWNGSLVFTTDGWVMINIDTFNDDDDLHDIYLQGLRYVSVSAGTAASYFLRSDGAVDRSKGSGTVSSTFDPPPGQRYTAVSSGTQCTYVVDIARSNL
jgi:hypothetical protein